MKLFSMRFPRISLHCKLVAVQYHEYENVLLPGDEFLNFDVIQNWSPFTKKIRKKDWSADQVWAVSLDHNNAAVSQNSEN